MTRELPGESLTKRCLLATSRSLRSVIQLTRGFCVMGIAFVNNLEASCTKVRMSRQRSDSANGSVARALVPTLGRLCGVLEDLAILNRRTLFDEGVA